MLKHTDACNMFNTRVKHTHTHGDQWSPQSQALGEKSGGGALIGDFNSILTHWMRLHFSFDMKYAPACVLVVTGAVATKMFSPICPRFVLGVQGGFFPL